MNTQAQTLPMPPLEYRKIVGPTDTSYFDNTSGALIWGDLDYGPLGAGDAYSRIFDFGCGCGRTARQLLQQKLPPEKYVGVDIHAGMIEWCAQNLASEIAEFHFHDVWNRTYAPDNKRNSVQPVRCYGQDFTLINVHSVFTHTYAEQTQYYLNEFAQMLAPNGIIRSTWFIFNRAWFPMLTENQHCLYVNETDPTQAVYYDWRYIVRLIKSCGLRLIAVNWTELAGYQSELFMAASDEFEDILDTTTEPPASVLGFGPGKPSAT